MVLVGNFTQIPMGNPAKSAPASWLVHFATPPQPGRELAEPISEQKILRHVWKMDLKDEMVND